MRPDSDFHGGIERFALHVGRFAMEEGLASQLEVLVRRSDQVLRRAARSSTHAVFSGRHGRFVAAKVGSGMLGTRGGESEPVQDRISRMLREPVVGVAPLLDVGPVGSREGMVMDLLPGRPLSRLLAEDVAEISGWIAEQALRIARDMVVDRGIRPVWSAETVHLWRDASGSLRLGLADYEFGPGRCRTRDEAEARAVAEFVAWARGLGGAAEAMFSVEEEWATFADVAETLHRWPSEEPKFALDMDAEMWSWLPGTERLPDWYAYGVRRGNVFDAEDLRRGERVRVHLLPPEAASGESWEPYLRQAAALARGERIEGFRAVHAVLRDPSCRLVVEEAGGMTLAELLRRRPSFPDQDRIAILRAVSETVDRLRREGWKVPSQGAEDVRVREDRESGRDASYAVELRAFPGAWLHARFPVEAGWGRWRESGAWFSALAAEVFASGEAAGGLRPEVSRSLLAVGRLGQTDHAGARAWCLARLEAACGLGPMHTGAGIVSRTQEWVRARTRGARRTWPVGAGALSVLAVLGLAWASRPRQGTTGLDQPVPYSAPAGAVLADVAPNR